MYNISDKLSSIIRNGLTTTNSKIEIGDNVLDDNDIYSFEIEDDLGIDGQPSIGSAVSKSMTLEIVPDSASMVLTGKAIKVSLGYNLDETEDEITQESEVEYIPFGTFYADPGTVQYGEDRITVECYDKIYYWDKAHYATMLAYPASIRDMLVEISNLTGVPLENINQIEDTTWLSRPAKSIRQMLSAIAEINGKQAIISRNEKIAFIQNHVPFNICIQGKTVSSKSVASSGNINIYVMNKGITGDRNLYKDTGEDYVLQAKNSGDDSDNYNYANVYWSKPLEKDKTYTISGSVQFTNGFSDKITILPIYSPATSSYTVSVGSNGFFSLTFTITSDITTQDRTLFYAGLAGQTRGKGCVFSNLKLELGDKATPWIPALEDANITDYYNKYTLSELPPLYAISTVFDSIQRDSNGIWTFYHNCSMTGGVVTSLTTPYKEPLSQANQNVLNSITATPNNKIFVTSAVDPDFQTNVELYAFDSDDYNQNGFTVTDECNITKLVNHLAVEEAAEFEEETEEEETDIEYGTDTGKALTIENENIRSIERLQSIYDKCFPLTWRAFELSLCFGSSWIDAGDIITVTDIVGNAYNLPVMSHVFRYDGGASSEMSASIGEEDNTVSYGEDYSQKIINTEKTVGRIKNQITGITSNVKGVTTRVSIVEQTVGGISQTVKENYEALYQAIDASGTYSIKIESDSSYAVKVDKTYNLSCFVYRINENITSTLDASQFRWFRVSTDEMSDLNWNAAGHIGSHLSISSRDINEDSCVFYCEVAIYSGKNVALTDRSSNRLCYHDGSPIMVKELICLLKTGVPMKDSTDNYKATFDMLKDKILLMLDHNGKLAYIDLRGGNSTLLKLVADMISLEGYTSINGNFTVDKDGNVHLKGGSDIDLVSTAHDTAVIVVRSGDYITQIEPRGIWIFDGNGNDKASFARDGFWCSGDGQLRNLAVGGWQTVNGYQIVSGSQTVDGDQTVSGSQTVDGNQSVSGSQTVDGDVYLSSNLRVIKDTYLDGTLWMSNNIGAYTTNVYNIGASNLRFKCIYLATSPSVSSDRNQKKDFNELDNRYSNFFMKLLPEMYKYIDGESNRFHVGFIAQEVEQAMIDSGLTSLDFAGFIKSPIYIKDEDGNDTETIDHYVYSLRYEEFIAIITKVLQDAVKRQDSLEARIQALEERIGD